MGGRKAPGLPVYFEQLGEALRSLAAIADDGTTLVQVVAFANPEWQLSRYLEVAKNSGWQELGLASLMAKKMTAFGVPSQIANGMQQAVARREARVK